VVDCDRNLGTPRYESTSGAPPERGIYATVKVLQRGDSQAFSRDTWQN